MRDVRSRLSRLENSSRPTATASRPDHAFWGAVQAVVQAWLSNGPGHVPQGTPDDVLGAAMERYNDVMAVAEIPAGAGGPT